MKIFYRISIFCVLIIVSVFYLLKAYQYFYPTHKKSQLNNKTNQISSVEVSRNASKTSCDTEFIIIEQDLNSDSYQTLIEKIPDQYIDKTRQQIVDILTLEKQAPILSERKKGLYNIQLSSFSHERLVIIKQYKTQEKHNYIDYTEDKEAVDMITGYYLIAFNDLIYVYQNSTNEIYMKTNIKIQDLPEHLVQEIMDKKYLKNDTELYNFLESYSS